MYYGYMSRSYDFIQLRREVEIGGNLEKGTYDYPFTFKSIELEMDSYNGIALNVDYSVTAEMVYTG